MHTLGRTAFFGQRWDSPLLDLDEGSTIEQVAPPVGHLCMVCDEPIEDSDRGLVLPVMYVVGQTRSDDWHPVHIECSLRLVLGSANHCKKLCACYGQDEQEWTGTAREEACEVMRIVNEGRAASGHAPL
jgi:hypothetical protein